MKEKKRWWNCHRVKEAKVTRQLNALWNPGWDLGTERKNIYINRKKKVNYELSL